MSLFRNGVTFRAFLNPHIFRSLSQGMIANNECRSYGSSLYNSNSSVGDSLSMAYTKYNQNPVRNFSEFKVPKKIYIPSELMEISFARSSGAGGQNVNKLNTKVEVRFHVMN